MVANNLIFDSIEDFYKKIEDDSCNLDASVSTAIKNLFDRTEDVPIKSKIQAEHYVFSFIIKEGEVTPQSSMAYEDGTEWSYPSYNDFSNEIYDYISARAKIVTNQYLKIRYNQIIWCSPLKPQINQAAKIIVDTSLTILSSVNNNKTDKEYWRWFEAIINGLRISMKIKYKVDNYVNALIQVAKNKKLNYQYKYFIIDALVDYPKYLTLFQDDIQKIQSAQVTKAKQEDNTTILRRMFSTGLVIAQKTKGKVQIWHERMGDLYVREAEKRMNDETKMVPLKFYKDAIPHYQLAGAKKKIKDIEKRYAELKNNLQLNTLELPIDDETINIVKGDIDARINALFQLESKDIYKYLANAEDILPDLAMMTAVSKKSGNTFSDLFTTLKFDINNNVRNGSEKNKQEQINEVYGLYLRLYVLPYLHRVFIGGFVDQKINYETLIGHFYADSWMGVAFQDSETNFGRPYNWVSLIAPSLFEYFKQTHFGINSLTNPKTNYILAIDSLTIKFEGALRDFGKKIGIVPTVSGKKNVLREKYIEEILSDEALKKYFNENEIFFFNYLFVSKDGFNLRNNIAHAFFKFNNYSYELMHLVMLAFLRLSKYNLQTSI